MYADSFIDGCSQKGILGRRIAEFGVAMNDYGSVFYLQFLGVKMITKIDKKSDDTVIVIGEHSGGYSGQIVFRDSLSGENITLTSDTSYSSNKKFIFARYPLFLLEIHIFDQNLVAKIQREEIIGIWSDLILSEAFSILGSTNQLHDAFLEIVNRIFDKGVEKGKTEKVNEFRTLLGLKGQ